MICFPLWWGLNIKVPSETWKGFSRPDAGGREILTQSLLTNRVASQAGIKSVIISLHSHVSITVTRVLKTFCLESQKQMFLPQLLIHNDVISSCCSVVLRKSANIVFHLHEGGFWGRVRVC